jgi:S1-C subfamily serine protease
MTPIKPKSQRKGATVRTWRFMAAVILTVAAVPSLYAQGRVGPQSVAPIAEKLIDAVVNISTSQTMKGAQGVPLPNVPKGSPFEEFFEDFFNRKGGRQQSDRKVRGSSSMPRKVSLSPTTMSLMAPTRSRSTSATAASSRSIRSSARIRRPTSPC